MAALLQCFWECGVTGRELVFGDITSDILMLIACLQAIAKKYIQHKTALTQHQIQG